MSDRATTIADVVARMRDSKDYPAAHRADLVDDWADELERLLAHLAEERAPQEKRSEFDLECDLYGVPRAAEDRAPVPQEPTRPLEVRNDEHGILDEVVAFGAYVHLERMSHSVVNLIVDDGTRHVILNIGGNRGAKVWATVCSDDPALPVSPDPSGSKEGV